MPQRHLHVEETPRARVPLQDDVIPLGFGEEMSRLQPGGARPQNAVVISIRLIDPSPGQDDYRREEEEGGREAIHNLCYRSGLKLISGVIQL